MDLFWQGVSVGSVFGFLGGCIAVAACAAFWPDDLADGADEEESE